MALPNLIGGGASATAMQQAIDALIVDRKSAVDRRDMNNKDMINTRIIQAQQFYLNGLPLGSGAFGSRTAVATGNPQVWNITATSVGNVDVRFNGLSQPQGNYTITGATAQPILLNPGFESDFTGWGTTSPEVISTANPHTGTKCASIIANNDYLYQTLGSLTLAASVTVTVWVRADAANTATAFLQLTDGATGPTVLSATVTPGIAWQQLTATYTVTATNNLFITLQRGATGSGTIYFDDVTSSAGTIINPGFETGDFTGWVLFPNAVISTVNPFGGAKSASLLADNAYVYQIVSALTAGVVYSFTAWCRGDSATTAPGLLIVQDSVGNNYAAVSMPTTTVWQPISINYTATPLNNVDVVMQRGVGVGNVYFDAATMSGGGVPSTWAITFGAGNQPLATGEDVTVSGNIS